MKKPFIVAGPCSAEGRRQVLDTCTAIAPAVDMLRAGVWKPRSHPGSFEGAGVRALGWLAEAKKITGRPVAVEVAGARHVESALRYGMDALWVGARTTVSPFAVQEIADAARGTGVEIMIKNPVNPDVELWVGAVERFMDAGFERPVLVHRGFSYYGRGRFRNAPMWHLAFEMRARFPGLTMLCDPSHIAGAREYVVELAQTAADLRYDGLMIESHISPSEALSDAGQQLTPAELIEILTGLRWRTEGDPSFDRRLERLRREIDQIDTELFGLLSRRMEIADRIGHEKRALNVAVLQDARWRGVVDKVTSQASELGLSVDFVRAILDAIHLESIGRQTAVINRKEV